MPTNLKPTAYDIEIKPYIGTEETYGDKAFTFEGRVIMKLTCEAPTNKIIFHAINLNIDAEKLELTSATDKDIKFDKNFKYESLREFVTVSLSRNCVTGAEYSLTVVYTGEILKATFGFYRSQYTEDGKTY